MRNPTDIKLCISLSHKYLIFRRPTYQLTQVVVCVILRCIILVSVCVMSGYCVISGCHVKLHHSCVSLCHVMLLCVCHFRVSCQAASFLYQSVSCHVFLYVSFQSVLHFMLLCVFRVKVDVSRYHVMSAIITSGILPFEFPSSQFIWLHSFIVLFVCLFYFCFICPLLYFIFAFYLPPPLKDKMMHVIKKKSLLH